MMLNIIFTNLFVGIASAAVASASVWNLNYGNSTVSKALAVIDSQIELDVPLNTLESIAKTCTSIRERLNVESPAPTTAPYTGKWRVFISTGKASSLQTEMKECNGNGEISNSPFWDMYVSASHAIPHSFNHLNYVSFETLVDVSVHAVPEVDSVKAARLDRLAAEKNRADAKKKLIGSLNAASLNAPRTRSSPRFNGWNRRSKGSKAVKQAEESEKGDKTVQEEDDKTVGEWDDETVYGDDEDDKKMRADEKDDDEKKSSR
jgi:hypothetical protein